MATDPVRHVIVLMLENHSFDQMLGSFQAVYPSLEGIDLDRPRSNQDDDGTSYPQQATVETSVRHDPMHELANVLFQVQDDNGNFVRDYARTYPETTTAERQQIMSYFAPDTLPALHALARRFTICDHWYSSVPGPTWTNRFFLHSGTSLGRLRMPEDLQDSVRHPALYFGYDQPTIFDRLNERSIPWRVYHGDIPQSLVLSHQRSIQNAKRYASLDVFYRDAAGSESAFPAYCFLEPSYYWPGQNDDHPPHGVLRAQALLGQVYNAVRQNELLWQSSLLVVLYDEHGGFYDHVSPPAAVPPDQFTQEGFTFDRLGVRVPALLVSPWVDPGIFQTELDHTSLLRYLLDKWQLGTLTERVAQAKSFAAAIRTTGQPRSDTPLSVPVPVLSPAVPVLTATDGQGGMELNAHQKALIAFTEHLEHEIHEPVAKPARMAAMRAGVLAQVETAKNRVKMFLAQQKAKALP